MNGTDWPGSEPPHILLIEDDPDVLALIEQLLVESGYSVAAVESGERGLALFDPRTVDLILLDAMLPGLNGWEVCQRIKSQPVHPYVPILMLTARAALQDRVRGLEAGADDYLTKPFDIDELLAHVRAMLRIRSAEVRIWQRSQDLEALNAIAGAVNASLDLTEILTLALTRVVTTAGAAVGGIWLAEADGTVFQLAVQTGLSVEQAAHLVQVQRAHPVVSRALAEGAPIRLPAAEDTALLGQALPPTGTSLYLPLASKGLAVGLLALGSQHAEAFAPALLRLLSTLSVTIAVAVDNARLYAQTRLVADTDPLTGLYNHRYMQDVIENELARADRSHRPFAIMMIDLDRFKSYNDTYGHPAGDRLLHDMAGMLATICRRTDTVGRYGGDEFIILLPETNAAQAQVLGNRIHAAYRALAADRDYDSVGISLSIGIAMYPADGQVRQQLINAADAAMYRAKHQGGGRIAVASTAASP
ncbi:MAG TPA: diguanylate cyclase [Dehalococcoidia bacterium]|nr:diguanylate cyclase [Dehalococcoidia bacterium]